MPNPSATAILYRERRCAVSMLSRQPGRRPVAIVALLIACVTSAVVPRPAMAAPNERSSAAIETAPVVIDGEVLFQVRGVTAFPAQKRAARIEERVRALAANPQFDPQAIQLSEGSDGSISLTAGDQPIFSVFEADAEMEKVPLAVLAPTYRERIIMAIQAYRHDRDPKVLAIRAAYALILTLAFVAVWIGLRWMSRRLDSLLAKQLQRAIDSLESKSYHIVRADHVWQLLRALLSWSRFLLVATVLYVYLNSVLGLFPWTQAVAKRLFGFVLEPLKTMGMAVIDFLPNLFFLVILVLVVRYLLKSTKNFFNAVERGWIKVAGFDAEWAGPTYRIVRLVAIALALVVAYPYIPGSESDAFKGVSLFFGVLLSLGSTSVISNVIAGYTMIYRRAFKIGDRIRIGETVGTVTARRVLVTLLRSIKNEEVVIPNSVVLNSKIVNFSTLAQDEGLILHTSVGIGYDVPWRQVEAMLLMAADRTPGLLGEPPPFVLQTGLGDFAVTYELNVYCDQADHMVALYSQLHRNILDVFNEYGVQIMTPAYVSDTAPEKTVAKERWYAAPAKPPTADTL